jgi:hypothetical protein
MITAPNNHSLEIMMKIRSAVAVLFGLLFCFLTTGCASIVSGTHQSVSVETPPMKNVSCTLSNDKGKWYVNSTPGSVSIHQSFKDLLVSCESKNHTPITKTVPSKVKPMMFGNILLGGLIGVVVDAAGGGGYQYPQTIAVPMENSAHP